MTLRLIELVQELHAQGIVHSNLNPHEVHLHKKNAARLFFPSLYFCSWETLAALGIFLPEDGDNLSLFDLRTRDRSYLAPEQLRLGEELAQVAGARNGRLDETSPEVLEFLMANRGKITKQCDVFAVGAVLYRLLLGAPPDPTVPEYIAKKRLHERSPDSNVYEVPYFLKDYILSNDMCYVLVRLLHQSPKHRFGDLVAVREDLQRLRENLCQTPATLRKILGHPVLPSEAYTRQALPKVIEFRHQRMSEFSLKYLAKFIYEHSVEQVSINGGAMPLLQLKAN